MLSGYALQIVNGGNYIVPANIISEATGFGSTTIALWIIRNGNTGSPLATYPFTGISRPSSGNVHTLTTGTPVALAHGDLLTVEADAGNTNVVDVTGGASTWLRATPG
ncbi:hypothetical protein [Nocardia sp. NPDC019395]|uniref:hypothetical protein n=1 Tax=Nocardia sp. NPDC019395 TaxID=3154686 RepID=UPI00340B4CD5